MCSLVCLILIIDNTRHTYVVPYTCTMYTCVNFKTHVHVCISKLQEKENLLVNVIVHVSVNAIIQILIRQIHIVLGQVGEKILEVLNKNAFLKCTYYCSKSNLAIIVTNHAENVRYSPSFGRELCGIRYLGLRRCLAMAVSLSLHNEGSTIFYHHLFLFLVQQEIESPLANKA